MKVHSYNEWDPLRSIVVGTATNANWPGNDPVFARESEKTLWKETPPPSGPVPQWIIDDTNRKTQTTSKIQKTELVSNSVSKNINETVDPILETNKKLDSILEKFEVTNDVEVIISKFL